ncbi:MAG: NAD(+) diphosphatase [Paracoccaceae bacterium]
MRLAETVTFGGSALDRAAHLRADPAGIAALLANPATRALPIWRGKPLFCGTDNAAAAWLPLDSPVFQLADEPPTFLGLGDAGAHFAYDISGWEPQELPDTLGAFFDPSEQRHPGLPEDHRFAELRGVMTRLTPRDAELVATARAILGWHESHGFCAKCGAATLVGQAGWQRDCPACGAHHFPRTDPVVIMLITHGNSVLLGRSPGWPEGMYSLLAGFVEPGETIEAAVRREVFEEAGITVAEVGYLASQPWPFPSSLMLGCSGRATSNQITFDPTEIEEALWVSREQLMEVFAGNHTGIKPARKGAIAHFLLRNWLADRLD